MHLSTPETSIANGHSERNHHNPAHMEPIEMSSAWQSRSRSGTTALDAPQEIHSGSHRTRKSASSGGDVGSNESRSESKRKALEAISELQLPARSSNLRAAYMPGKNIARRSLGGSSESDEDSDKDEGHDSPRRHRRGKTLTTCFGVTPGNAKCLPGF